jgi:hypothetical protein
MSETIRVPIKVVDGHKWGCLAYISTEAYEIVGEEVKHLRDYSFAGGHRVRLYRFKKNVHFKIPAGVEVNISGVTPAEPPRRAMRR